ncbi:hypothetical protein M427DRAFT_461788 [Gonapodya prolifera JEL478]|uniref:Uncharacterized protein n=1 Tax=Gonapodya prolifera (strain JEL478) TaxID=1344416 RepID=A0A139A228_GONPJ|nr:hypothetical protein M427DRAFT_461788 [Gonapodya prolifera JEL478]|eukprot:KXS10794.1 hypothetical protein M427DRAFT_461788 [Gonapodya prolifera JEL478]
MPPLHPCRTTIPRSEMSTVSNGQSEVITAMSNVLRVVGKFRGIKRSSPVPASRVHGRHERPRGIKKKGERRKKTQKCHCVCAHVGMWCGVRAKRRGSVRGAPVIGYSVPH